MTEQLRRAVEAHGFVVVREAEVAGAPPASSTAGLTASGLPELVVLGLPEEVAHGLLDELARRLLAGEEPEDGAPLPGLLEGSEPVLLTVTTPVDGSPAAGLYGELVRMRQLVWPDAGGRLPWHEGADVAAQPLLGTPPEWPLEEDPHAQVLTSRPVARDGQAVLLVQRTDDGELRFLDGASDFDPDRAVVECLHDALERDLTLLAAVRLVDEGETAERDELGAPWSLSR